MVKQRSSAEFIRVKATAAKAIQAIYGSKNDVWMAVGSGFGILESEEEV